jgi:two-component system sensor histidine kinase YesM
MKKIRIEIKPTRTRSLRAQIRWALMTILSLSMSAVIVVTLCVFFNIRTNSETQTLTDETEKLKSDLFNYLASVEELAYTVGYSNQVQNLLGRNYSEEQRSALIDYVKYYLYSVGESNQDVQFAFLENTQNGYKPLGIAPIYSINPSINIKTSYFFKELEQNGYYIEISKPKQDIYTNYTANRITIYYLLHRANSFATSDIVIVTVPLKNVVSRISSFNSINVNLDVNSKTLIKSFSRSDSSFTEHMEYSFSSDFFNKREKEYTTQFLFHNDTFSMTSKIKDGNHLKIDSSILYLMLLTAIINCMVTLFFYVYLSKYFITPISAVSKAMQEIMSGNFGFQIEKNFYKDEIGTMINGYNSMSLSLEKLINENKEYAELQKEAQIKILQNQINPHFLANTLELINSLILSGKPEKAIEVSGALGKMYRYNQNLNSWSTVKEEIEYTLNYLTIMQYRISGLQYSVEIPNDLMHIRFMRVILQPLVENSILHGFETKREDCVISITLTQEDKKNVITVMDNGEGMSPEKLSELREKLDSIIADPSINNNTGSIGLANVIKRLRIEYGTAFQYRIVSVDERGTRISLLLPMEK